MCNFRLAAKEKSTYFCSNLEDGVVHSGTVTSTESFCGIYSVLNPSNLFYLEDDVPHPPLSTYSHVRFIGKHFVFFDATRTPNILNLNKFAIAIFTNCRKKLVKL